MIARTDGANHQTGQAAYRDRLTKPQPVPEPHECRIDDFFRVQWLMRHHMRTISSFEVSSRYPSPYLGQRDGELLIGFFAEPDGSWWRVASDPARGGLEMRRINETTLSGWRTP